MKQKETQAFINAVQEAMAVEYKRQVSIAIKQGIARKKQQKKAKQL